MTVAQANAQVKELERTCVARPSTENIANLAACYFTLGDPEAAYQLSEKVWTRSKNSPQGINLAMILKDLGRHEESLKVVEETYWQHPDDFYVRLAYGEGLLKAGHWNKAWPIYDNARPTQAGAAAHLSIPVSVIEWQEQEIKPNETLLVINEGGTGDRFNYPRWLPELTKRNIDWYFYTYDELFSFYERIFPRERLIRDGDEISPKYWTTTFALPARLGISPTTIPPPLNITSDPKKKNSYQFTKENNFPLIGICWSAAELFQGDRKVRSMTEGQMMRLVCMTAHKINWVNLQLGYRPPFPIVNASFKEWEDTAALIDKLDGVVTCDTGVMHLAGAMRKPMATVLSGNSCWKFLKTGKKDYWYPTNSLYRNQGHGMENAINALVKDIQEGNIFNDK